MINVNELRAQYPVYWAMSDEDNIAFLGIMVSTRKISRDEFNEWKEKVLFDAAPAVIGQRAKYWDISVLYPIDTEFMEALVAGKIITAEERDAILMPWLPAEELPRVVPEFVISKSIFETQIPWFAQATKEILKSLWLWLRDKMKELIDLVVGVLKPVLLEAWETAKKGLTEAGLKVYEGAEKLFEGHSPVAPEDAPIIAGKLYGMAWGAGMLAQGTAALCETFHPLKELGIHHTAAMVGDFAQFGRIAGATIGPLVNKVLGQLMTYNVQNRYRPMLPDDRLLQIMAVKPDITMAKFRKGMGYMGYSDEWIDSIQGTMFHEPRYFELKMMAEDEAAALPPGAPSDLARAEFARYNVKPSDQWLFMKSRRGGFTPGDSKVMVSSYIKAACRMQRMDFYRQAFYMYKEGYIGSDIFERHLEELELRPEAHHFAKRSAELAFLNDYIKDMISYYIDSYVKDLIDDDELLISLVSLGIIPKRAWLITAKAKVRKRPRPAKPTTKAAEKAASDVQKKYITLYITQYRKGLITDHLFLRSLLAVGLTPELAEVTVSLEAAKKGLLLPA